MYCANCGKKINERSSRCSFCGSQVDFRDNQGSRGKLAVKLVLAGVALALILFIVVAIRLMDVDFLGLIKGTDADSLRDSQSEKRDDRIQEPTITTDVTETASPVEDDLTEDTQSNQLSASSLVGTWNMYQNEEQDNTGYRTYIGVYSLVFDSDGTVEIKYYRPNSDYIVSYQGFWSAMPLAGVGLQVDLNVTGGLLGMDDDSSTQNTVQTKVLAKISDNLLTFERIGGDDFTIGFSTPYEKDLQLETWKERQRPVLNSVMPNSTYIGQWGYYQSTDSLGADRILTINSINDDTISFDLYYKNEKLNFSNQSATINENGTASFYIESDRGSLNGLLSFSDCITVYIEHSFVKGINADLVEFSLLQVNTLFPSTTPNALYIGDWGEDYYPDTGWYNHILSVTSVDGATLTFDIEYYRIASFENIQAAINEDGTASFYIEENGSILSGTLYFSDTITMEIQKSTFYAINAEVIVFTPITIG